MRFPKDNISLTLKALLCLSMVSMAAAPVTTSQQEEQLKTVSSRLDSLGEYASSTTNSKDDLPVSMSGDIFVRLKDLDYFHTSKVFNYDKARTWVDGGLDLALAAYPNTYVSLWTTFFMPFDFSGWYTNKTATNPNTGSYFYDLPERMSYHHHIDLYGPSIWEELTAGVDLRSAYFGAMFKAGGVLWVHSSPLTVWERETYPRFPSVYETFEEERTVSTYYKEKMFRPVKEGGRAFWTNRSFGGIMLDIYKLPFNMTGHILISQPKDADQGTRDGLTLWAGQYGDEEMAGTLNYRGDVYNVRLAKEKIGPGLTLGANYVQMDFDNDLIYEEEFMNMITGDGPPTIVNSRVGSVDIKGNLNSKLFMAVDVAAAVDDSVKFRSDESRSITYVEDDYKETTSDPTIAAYAKIQSKHWIPITSEIIYAPKNFFSPYAMTDYSRNRTWRKDEMYLGAGTFRYSPNLMGVNLKIEPEFNRGRFDVQYGLHRQVEKGLDILSFNYRLNGRYMWESMTSWSKYASILRSDSGYVGSAAKYDYRIASLEDTTSKLNRQEGGLRGGTWETWEVFAPYDNADQIANSEIPTSAKWSSVIAVDMAYDIGNLIGYDKNVMLHLNTAVSGIARSFIPVAYSESQNDMLLWSWFGQSEPSIAITPTFHVLGCFGWEIFRAEKAWKAVQVAKKKNELYYEYELAPINYLDLAFGGGFDWDFTPRAGLHVRYRYATHRDETVSSNNWKAHFISAETKVWF
ncbi:MAG TPA: hypothetical protein VLM37_10905 [Fibrobacteraceae bacterium]|nr:hypothetical protein [Fibrobacteraceae bacterium]